MNNHRCLLLQSVPRGASPVARHGSGPPRRPPFPHSSGPFLPDRPLEVRPPLEAGGRTRTRKGATRILDLAGRGNTQSPQIPRRFLLVSPSRSRRRKFSAVLLLVISLAFSRDWNRRERIVSYPCVIFQEPVTVNLACGGRGCSPILSFSLPFSRWIWFGTRLRFAADYTSPVVIVDGQFYLGFRRARAVAI